jgi:hypothetical protein
MASSAPLADSSARLRFRQRSKAIETVSAFSGAYLTRLRAMVCDGSCDRRGLCRKLSWLRALQRGLARRSTSEGASVERA